MVTVLDVAKRAGVSPATVSRVLSDQSVVAPATKERVRRAVSELGYEPNLFARALRSGKSNAVAFAIGDIEQYVYLQLSQHMQIALEGAGRDLLLFNLGHRGDRFEAILNRAKALRLSGLILATSDPVDTVAIKNFRLDVDFSSCPIIVVGQDATADGIPSVWHDDGASAAAATTYLLRQGCRKVGYVGRIQGSAVGSWRYQGYRHALLEWGADPEPDRVFDCAFRYPAGYEAGQKIAARRGEFDAVICGSDEMALGVISALSDAGIAVPEELSVFGFGDIEWSSFVRPALSTLSTNYSELAAQATSVLMACEEPEVPVLNHRVERNLILRGSTL